MPTAGRLFCIVAFIFSLLNFHSISFAADPEKYATHSATITATIPEFTINGPVLIAPRDELVTNNPYEPFLFYRSDPGTYIHHYDLYIDNIKVAGDISHSSLYQDAYFFTMERIGEVVTVRLKDKIADGYHSWHVIAVTNSGQSGRSDTWHFWLDSASPIIILEQVEKNHLYWSTNDPYNIPPRDQRNFIVDTPDPYLAGKVEAYSNLKLSLVCPENAPPNCQNQSITVYQPTGVWQHRFRGLLEGVNYLVYIFATDAAGNTNSLPEFSITYTPTPSIIQIIFPTKTPTRVTPTPTPTPITTPTPTLPVLYEIEPSVPLILTPPKPPSPPPIPTPPPPPPTKQANFFFLIAIIALLIHLTLLSFSISTKLTDFIKLLFILLIPPFIRRYQHLTASIMFESKTKNATLFKIKLLPFAKIYPISLDIIKNKLNTLKEINTHQLYSLLKPLIELEKHYHLANSAGEFNLELKNKTPLVIFPKKPGFIFPPSTSISNHLKKIPNNTLIYFGQIIEAKLSKNNLIIFLDPNSKDLLTPIERLQLLSQPICNPFIIISFISCLTSLYYITSFSNLLLLFLITIISTNEYVYPIMKTKQLEKTLINSSDK